MSRLFFFFFFSSRRRHTRCSRDWSSDVCSSDLRGLPDARIACLIAVPNQGKWREGLAEAQAELRRFAETGPTPLEVETAAEQIRRSEERRVGKEWRSRGAAYE